MRRIIDGIDAAASRWRDARFEPRRLAREAVAARTGYSLAIVDYALDRLFEVLTAEGIASIIADELGSLDVLDGFVQRGTRGRARALALGRVCIVASRTTVGVAIVPAIFALVAKCEVLVKDREDRLAAAFFETLGEELPELRDSAVARCWRGNEGTLDLRAFDGVVAFGEEITLRQIGERLTPRTRFIPFGPKASAGYIPREALGDEAAAASIARRAATDVVLYETEGCLSMHVLFIEDGAAVTPQRFRELLGESVRALATAFPPSREPATAAASAIAGELATFRGGSDRLYVSPSLEEAPLFLPRAPALHHVDGPQDALRYLERHGIELEALAVAGCRDDLASLAMGAKAGRIVPFGRMQAPPLGAFHGGRPRVAEFVRWIGDET